MKRRWCWHRESLTEKVPAWQGANAPSIDRSLERALAKPTGGWFVLDATRRIKKPRKFHVAGQELVAWRVKGELQVAPNSCPHMGAELAGCAVDGLDLVCPWHGLKLGKRGHGLWQPLRAHDDGVLAWVQLPGVGEELSTAPTLPPRPTEFIEGTVFVEASCAPRDILANRLDPWHGAHFHPYSFGALEVLSETENVLTVRVEKRLAGKLSTEVDATFHCPDSRTIVMTIVEGEGVGSVVETHATPLRPGRTAVIEATLAASDRTGFRPVLKLARFIRPFIERSARRLWVDDAAYAERLYELREGSAAAVSRY